MILQFAACWLVDREKSRGKFNIGDKSSRISKLPILFCYVIIVLKPFSIGFFAPRRSIRISMHQGDYLSSHQRGRRRRWPNIRACGKRRATGFDPREPPAATGTAWQSFVFDMLEERQLLATITVNTVSDTTSIGTTLSLRQAIEISDGTLPVSSLSGAQQALVLVH